MPYCHQLPFADFHQWDAEVRHADFTAPERAEWCDYVAREYCSRMKDDQKLIGHFYLECPTWIHTRPENEWKGPLFDPEKVAANLTYWHEKTGKPVLLNQRGWVSPASMPPAWYWPQTAIVFLTSLPSAP